MAWWKKFSTHKRLIINVALTLLALAALTMAIVAWFSNQLEANITTLNMQVEDVDWEVQETADNILFPCATKITDTTAALFNEEAACMRTYSVFGGAGGVLPILVSVQNEFGYQNAGLLAYVCDSTQTTDGYAEVTAKLEEKLGTDRADWTYAAMKNALTEINTRTAGNLSADGTATEIKVLYWVEYDEVSAKLNGAGLPYWNSQDIGSDQYCVRVRFARSRGGSA